MHKGGIEHKSHYATRRGVRDPIVLHFGHPRVIRRPSWCLRDLGVLKRDHASRFRGRLVPLVQPALPIAHRASPEVELGAGHEAPRIGGVLRLPSQRQRHVRVQIIVDDVRRREQVSHAHLQRTKARHQVSVREGCQRSVARMVALWRSRCIVLAALLSRIVGTPVAAPALLVLLILVSEHQPILQQEGALIDTQVVVVNTSSGACDAYNIKRAAQNV